MAKKLEIKIPAAPNVSQAASRSSDPLNWIAEGVFQPSTVHALAESAMRPQPTTVHAIGESVISALTVHATAAASAGVMKMPIETVVHGFSLALPQSVSVSRITLKRNSEGELYITLDE